MTESKKTERAVTWDDLGELACALFHITQANLSEELVGEMAAPLILRMGTFGGALLREADQMRAEYEVVVDLAPKSAVERVRMIQEEIETKAREAQTPWEPGEGTVVAWAEPTAKMRMEMTRKGLKEARAHLAALETMAPRRKGAFVVLGGRLGDIQRELGVMQSGKWEESPPDG